ncbi:hypothetical protein RRG08_031200 [Elysia crispata]|uniref:Uncharacterized protein n=1 Tax=Elysia crispata TaxID=231223 RepID=A0AAE1CJ71_9GAST|nr:hypothetical protein RRG08_031200 [Elysia crispata]
MPRAFLITHKRRFEEGLEAPMQTSVSSHGPWDGEKIEGGCEPMTDSNMLDHTMRGFRGGSSGSSSGDSGVGSPGVDPGRLPDSPRSESALRETPSSVLGHCFVDLVVLFIIKELLVCGRGRSMLSRSSRHGIRKHRDNTNMPNARDAEKEASLEGLVKLYLHAVTGNSEAETPQLLHQVMSFSPEKEVNSCPD